MEALLQAGSQLQWRFAGPQLPSNKVQQGIATLKQARRAGFPSSQAVAAPSRVTTIEHVEAAHPEVLHAKDFDADFAQNFAQYQKATHSLDALAAKSSELEAFLQNMNTIESQLDASLLAVPIVEDKAARKAKRAAKRAERLGGKSTATATPARATVTAPPQHVQPPSHSVDSSPGHAALDNRQQLEELFMLSAPEPTVAFTSAPPLQRDQQKSVLKPKKRKAPSPTAPVLPAAEPPVQQPYPAQFWEQQVPDSASTSPSRPAEGLQPVQDVLLAPTLPALIPLPEVEHQPEYHPPPEPEYQPQPEYAPDLEEGQELPQLPQSDDMQLLEPVEEAAAQEEDVAMQQELDIPPATLPSEPVAQVTNTSSSRSATSALSSRELGQTSLTAAGPSLLSAARGGAATGAARSTHSRRAAVYGKSTGAATAEKTQGVKAKAAATATDGTTRLMQQADVGLLGDQEADMTRACKDYLFLESMRQEVQKAIGRPPSRTELAAALDMHPKSLMARYEAGQAAKAHVMRANYRLVMSIAKKYLNKGSAMQDLVAEGIKGLMKGVEKYEPNKGFKFSTYAHWWIRQAISRSLTEHGRAVRLPVHLIEQLSKVNNARQELADELDRDPTEQEVADKVGIPLKKLRALLAASAQSSSLDASFTSDGDGTSLKDTLEDTRGGADAAFEDEGIRGDLEEILGTLKERDQMVLRLRFGLVDGQEWTLEDIGKHLSVTRERVRQIEAKALLTLRSKQEALKGKLVDYIEGADLLEEMELTARTSSGTKKSS